MGTGIAIILLLACSRPQDPSRPVVSQSSTTKLTISPEMNPEGIWISGDGSTSKVVLEVIKHASSFVIKVRGRSCLTSTSGSITAHYANGVLQSSDSLPGMPGKPCALIAIHVSQGEFLVPKSDLPKFERESPRLRTLRLSFSCICVALGERRATNLFFSRY